MCDTACQRANGFHFLRLVELMFQLLTFLFCTFLLGDILGGTQCSNFPLKDENAHAQVDGATDATILVENVELIFAFNRFPCHQLAVMVYHKLAVFRRYQRKRVHLKHFLDRIAVHSREGLVDKPVLSTLQNKDAILHVFHKRPVFFFGMPPFFHDQRNVLYHLIGDDLQGFEQFHRRRTGYMRRKVAARHPAQHIEMFGKTDGKFMRQIHNFKQILGSKVDFFFQAGQYFDVRLFRNPDKGIAGCNFLKRVAHIRKLRGHGSTVTA